MKSAFYLCSLAGAQRYRILLPTDRYPCNPSIARNGDHFLLTVRCVNYRLGPGGTSIAIEGGEIDTENWLVALDADLKPSDKKRIDDRRIRPDARAARGLEDARLFHWRGDWWFIASGLSPKPAKTTMALCRLQGSEVVEARFIPSPLNAALEKNWMPLVDGGNLTLLYRTTPTSVVHCSGDAFEFRAVSPGNEQYPEWSGSSQCVPYGDHFLCVIHKKTRLSTGWRYAHVLLEIDCGFRVRRESAPWYFDKPTIEFCAGLCLTDTRAIFSYGHMDREARMLSLPLPAIEGLLQGEPPRGFLPRAKSLVGGLWPLNRPQPI